MIRLKDHLGWSKNNTNFVTYWSLVQLYIVSDLVPRSEPSQIYAALFQNLHHKNINLTPIRLKHEQVQK